MTWHPTSGWPPPPRRKRATPALGHDVPPALPRGLPSRWRSCPGHLRSAPCASAARQGLSISSRGALPPMPPGTASATRSDVAPGGCCRPLRGTRRRSPSSTRPPSCTPAWLAALPCRGVLPAPSCPGPSRTASPPRGRSCRPRRTPVRTTRGRTRALAAGHPRVETGGRSPPSSPAVLAGRPAASLPPSHNYRALPPPPSSGVGKPAAPAGG